MWIGRALAILRKEGQSVSKQGTGYFGRPTTLRNATNTEPKAGRESTTLLCPPGSAPGGRRWRDSYESPPSEGKLKADPGGQLPYTRIVGRCQRHHFSDCLRLAIPYIDSPLFSGAVKRQLRSVGKPSWVMSEGSDEDNLPGDKRPDIETAFLFFRTMSVSSMSLPRTLEHMPSMNISSSVVHAMFVLPALLKSRLFRLK